MFDENSCWRTVPWLKIFRVCGIVCGLAIIGLGIYELVADARDPKAVVDQLYRILFGTLIIIAEFQLVQLLDWFSFLLTLIGLGGFYIFVGGLALGSAAYEIVIAVVLCFIGIMYCIAGATCNDDRPVASDLKAGGAGQQAQSSGPQMSSTELKAAAAKPQWPLAPALGEGMDSDAFEDEA